MQKSTKPSLLHSPCSSCEVSLVEGVSGMISSAVPVSSEHEQRPLTNTTLFSNSIHTIKQKQEVLWEEDTLFETEICLKKIDFF